jgi:hypothetical protein
MSGCEGFFFGTRFYILGRVPTDNAVGLAVSSDYSGRG